MIKLSPTQIKAVRSYICMRESNLKACSKCPFFSNLKQCNKKRNVVSKKQVEEIANAWEVVLKELR